MYFVPLLLLLQPYINGARAVIPVDSVPKAIEMGKSIDGIAAGERDGMIAEGLQHGNSPLEYTRSFIENRNLVLTTTNGTRLLQMALDRNASTIIAGSFPNLSSNHPSSASLLQRKAVDSFLDLTYLINFSCSSSPKV